jgi:hypothetical protein
MNQATLMVLVAMFVISLFVARLFAGPRPVDHVDRLIWKVDFLLAIALVMALFSIFAAFMAAFKG